MSNILLLIVILMVVRVIESQGFQKLQLDMPTDSEEHIDNNTAEYFRHEESFSNRMRTMNGLDPSSRRILGGYISQEGQQPYQGLLEIKYRTKSSVCGCSILSRTWVLTAAHCCINCLDVDVIVGSNSLTSGTRIRHATFIPHEHYDDTKKINDIAMVKISPITFSKTIKSIALPSREELMKDWANSVGIVSGFGRFEGNQQSDVKRYTYVNILTNKRCHQLDPSFVDNKMCSVGIGGACNGDSGGPLAVESNSRTVLVGIVSYGRLRGIKHECSIQRPVVYTRVSSYVHWIKALM